MKVAYVSRGGESEWRLGDRQTEAEEEDRVRVVICGWADTINESFSSDGQVRQTVGDAEGQWQLLRSLPRDTEECRA